MAAQNADRAAGQVAEVPPIPELVHVFEAVLSENLRLDRDRRIIGDVSRRAERTIPLAVEAGDLAADPVPPDQSFQRVAIPWIAAPLVADLAELAGFFRRFDHGPGTVDGVGHHFLAIDVQARCQALHGVRRVPEIWRGDDGGIAGLKGGWRLAGLTMDSERVAARPIKLSLLMGKCGRGRPHSLNAGEGAHTP